MTHENTSATAAKNTPSTAAAEDGDAIEMATFSDAPPAQKAAGCGSE